MDWESTANDLRRMRQPAMLVDRARRARFTNAPMEKLLGRDADELRRRAWIALCVPAADRGHARQLVDQALRGVAAEGELPVVTAGERRISVRVAFERVGHGPQRGIVLTVREVRDRDEKPWPSCECCVDIARDGTIAALRFLDGAHDPRAYAGKPLRALLEDMGAGGAESVIAPANGESRPVVVLPRADEAFRVVTAVPKEHGAWRVKVRCVDAGLLADLVDAKVARVAEASGLSARERQVLTLLLRGRGLEDIGTMLEIAPRTVKFHQANVLQKLGADSRVDLLRVVL